MAACKVSGVTTTPPLDHLRHGFEDAAMQRIVEMLRLDQRASRSIARLSARIAPSSACSTSMS